LLFLQKLFGEPHEPPNFAYGAAFLLKFGSGRKFFLCIVQLLPEFGKGQRHFDILSQLRAKSRLVVPDIKRIFGGFDLSPIDGWVR
jgi:hypothetical protein